MRYKKHIKSLQRGLRILEAFGESSRPLTLTEVATLNQLNKTATQRFLNTLCSLGYINRDENKRYSLSLKILSLGFGFLNSSNLRMMVKPYVEELSHELEKTVNLSVLDGIDILFLCRKEVRRFLKYDLQAGSKLPAFCTASGKVLLAGLADDELRKRIDKIEFHQITPKTIVSKEDLWKEVMKTRKKGYGICDQELSMDLCSIAVPLINGQGRIVAAINVSFEAKDKDRKNKENILPKLSEKGEMISRALGYQGPYPPALSGM